MKQSSGGGEFYKGFVVAVGTLARNGYPSLATDVMTCNGVTLKELEDAGAEDFDLDPIREEMAGEK